MWPHSIQTIHHNCSLHTLLKQVSKDENEKSIFQSMLLGYTNRLANVSFSATKEEIVTLGKKIKYLYTTFFIST